MKGRCHLGGAGQASCPTRCVYWNHNGTYNRLSASFPLSSSCSVCAVSTARPEESRGSDCGTGRGLAYMAAQRLLQHGPVTPVKSVIAPPSPRMGGASLVDMLDTNDLSLRRARLDIHLHD